VDGTKQEEEAKNPNLWLGDSYRIRPRRLRHCIRAPMVHQEPAFQKPVKETRHVLKPTGYSYTFSIQLTYVNRRERWWTPWAKIGRNVYA
jgi:hypothetical protein